jgi:hypothetical protein
MRLVFAILLAGCSVAATPPAATHPASASAPTGRLAGAPPSLRAGVVVYPDVPPLRAAEPAGHHHHH